MQVIQRPGLGDLRKIFELHVFVYFWFFSWIRVNPCSSVTPSSLLMSAATAHSSGLRILVRHSRVQDPIPLSNLQAVCKIIWTSWIWSLRVCKVGLCQIRQGFVIATVSTGRSSTAWISKHTKCANAVPAELLLLGDRLPLPAVVVHRDWEPRIREGLGEGSYHYGWKAVRCGCGCFSFFGRGWWYTLALAVSVITYL